MASRQPDELILAMQHGDEAAFASIYDRYAKAINGIILTIVRDPLVAEEVLQDVFIKVWKNAPSYSSEKGRFYTWLLNIARNAAIDKIRSKTFKNDAKNLSEENFVNSTISHDDLSTITDAIGLKKYIDALKPTCIQLIELLYFKGYTQVETAEALSSPLGTVKTRIRNCINQLRQIIGE
jgi:RNA polymerase sigma-70 factor (ECF subfamily)